MDSIEKGFSASTFSTGITYSTMIYSDVQVFECSKYLLFTAKRYASRDIAWLHFSVTYWLSSFILFSSWSITNLGIRSQLISFLYWSKVSLELLQHQELVSTLSVFLDLFLRNSNSNSSAVYLNFVVSLQYQICRQNKQLRLMLIEITQ